MSFNYWLNTEEKSQIITSKKYLEIYNFIKDLIQESRSNRFDAEKLLKFQEKVIVKLLELEAKIRFFKEKANRHTRNTEWFIREVSKAQRLTIKRVMDGIAWRMLAYDRSILRQLSAHQQSGHLEEGTIYEFKKATKITSKYGYYVLLNDLTNFLKYEDLTIIGPKKIFLFEVKKKQKVKIRQKKTMKEILHLLNSNKINIKGDLAERLIIPGRPVTFLLEVEKIIKRSKLNSNGISSKKVSPYMWICSVFIDKFIKKYSEKSLYKTIDPPFNRNDRLEVPCSMQFYMMDFFSPNFPPYSIFPFSDEVVTNLLTYRISLVCFISKSKLKKSLKGKGWDIYFFSEDIPDRLYIDRTRCLDQINRTKNNDSFMTNKDFVVKIPFEYLCRMPYEFRSAKTFAQFAEKFREITSKSKKAKYVIDIFSEEKKIWR